MECAQLRCAIDRTFSITMELISDSTVVMCILLKLSSQRLLRIRNLKLCGGKARFIRHPLCGTRVHCTLYIYFKSCTYSHRSRTNEKKHMKER